MALCTRCGRQTEGAAEFCSGCARHSGSNGWGRPQAIPAATATADYLRPFAPESSGSPPSPGDAGRADWAAPRAPLAAPAESEEWAFPSPSGRLPDFPPLPRVPYDARRGRFEPDNYPDAAGAPADPSARRLDAYQPDAYQADAYRPGTYRPDAFADAYRPGAYRPDADRPGAYRPEAERPDGYRPDVDRPETDRPDAYEPNGGGPEPHQPDPGQADQWRPDREIPRGPFTPAGPRTAAGPSYPGAESFPAAPSPFPPPDQPRPAAFVRPSGLLPGGYSDDDRYPAGDSYPASDGRPADDSSPGPAARLRWSASPAQLADPLGPNAHQAYDPGQPADSDRPVPGQLAAGQFAPGYPAAGQFTPGQFTPGQFTPDQNGLGQNGPAQALGQAAIPPPAWTAPDQLPAPRLPLDAATAAGPSDTGILREPGWRQATRDVPAPDGDQDPTDSAAPTGSRYPSHPPSKRVKPPRAPGQHNGRWVSIAAAAVVLVICVITASILLSRGKPATKGSPRAASTHSPRSAPAPVVNGLVTIDPAAAGESSAPAVVSFLSRYFTAINHHDFAAYRLLFSTSLRGGLSSAAFGRGYGTSRDSLVTLHTVSAAGTAELDAAVTFTSRQRPDASPTHSACTAWVISLYLVQQGHSYVLVSPPAGYEASFSDCS